MRFIPHPVSTRDGWTLMARRVAPEHRGGHLADQPPVLLLPGYGMNSFIFGYHPTGPSFLEALAARGLDAWTVDLRGQGRSFGSGGWGLREQALEDLPALVTHLRRQTGAPAVDLIGCSLGGTLIYAWLAHCRAHGLESGVRRVVTMGSPLRFTKVHPAVAAVGLLGGGVARLPLRGVRPLARAALPWLAQNARSQLAIYLNADLTDTQHAEILAETVEDPKRSVNVEILRWLRRGRLVLGDLDVARALEGATEELLVVIGFADRICNPESCRSVLAGWAPGQARELLVGGPELPVAHADLFISRVSGELVFPPVADFLESGL